MFVALTITAKIVNFVRWNELTLTLITDSLHFTDYCPFGPSWFGLPSQSNLRNVSFSTCSDMVN